MDLGDRHEPGYDISISDGNVGQSKLEIIVQSIKGIPNRQTRIDVTGQKTTYLNGDKKVISIPVHVPEGESRTFTYTVTVAEEGCPIMKKTVSKTITMPKQRKGEKKKGEKKKKVIII